ncbi:hypothetical protein Y032_0372g152 [Ancylostoma ceylanicum]|uniref:Uncharacterized protein n=1 Tax=Ancylostoma ceylanicum TaxID=53326 RepID=A0A016RV69_9BILA|nr:hypothetical protein Y032_0372g152 [Ancylostoma ceylanicum]
MMLQQQCEVTATVALKHPCVADDCPLLPTVPRRTTYSLSKKIIASCYTAHLLSRAAPSYALSYVLRFGSVDAQCSVR